VAAAAAKGGGDPNVGKNLEAGRKAAREFGGAGNNKKNDKQQKKKRKFPGDGDDDDDNNGAPLSKKQKRKAAAKALKAAQAAKLVGGGDDDDEGSESDEMELDADDVDFFSENAAFASLLQGSDLSSAPDAKHGGAAAADDDSDDEDDDDEDESGSDDSSDDGQFDSDSDGEHETKSFEDAPRRSRTAGFAGEKEQTRMPVKVARSSGGGATLRASNMPGKLCTPSFFLFLPFSLCSLFSFFLSLCVLFSLSLVFLPFSRVLFLFSPSLSCSCRFCSTLLSQCVAPFCGVLQAIDIN
jgi:hypothetical protein